MALDRIKAPLIKDAVDFDIQLKPCQHFTLDNGVEVYSYEGGAEEVMMMDLVFYAGNCYEEKNWVAAATNFLLKNGTHQRTAFELNDYFEFYGAYVNRTCYNETATINLHTLTKHFEALLPVLSELITESNFSQEELSIYQQNQLQRLTLNLKKSDFVANRLIDEYLFGIDHPYGTYSTEASFKNLTREDLVHFYDRFYKHGKLVVFMAGKFPKNMQSLMNQYIGGLPLNQAAMPNFEHPMISAAQKKYSIVNDASSVQGSIRMARRFPNRHHPDFPGTQVLNNVFGGFFGSRLMRNIREDKGYTYGIHSYLQNHVQECAWMISTDAGKDVCGATISEVYKEMGILRDELMDEAELKLVKNYMLGALLGDLDGPFQIINRWKTYLLNDLDIAYFNKTIEIVRAIQPADLQALANQYLQPEDFYELVVY